MEKIISKLIILILVVSAVTLSAESECVVRIQNFSKELISWLDTAGKSAQIIYMREHLDLIADTQTINYLEAQNISYDVQKTKEQIIRDLENYHSYDTMLAEIQAYADDFPELTTLYSLGPSTCNIYYQEGNDNYEGFQHEIWCMKVSDNPLEEEDEPNILFCSAIHAREPISLEVVLAFMEDFFSGIGTDPEIDEFIANNQIWFVPLINPDGHKVVFEEQHLMHRKNMRDNNENGMPDYSTTDGVDLNRNFGYVWGPNGTSSSPSSSLYNGPEAWSEIETQYLRDLYRERKFWAGFTYHSQGEYVLYPLGHLPGVCSYDHEIMGDLAVAMSETMPRLHQTGNYRPRQAVDFGYTCQGTMGDWSYSEERIFGYTIELADEFIPDDPTQCCNDNLEAFRVALHRFDDRLLTGHVTDPWGAPLTAEVNVVQIDEAEGMTDVEPYKCGHNFGRYWRPLLPGIYDVEFSLEGYDTSVNNDITVSNGMITELDAVLYPDWYGEHEKGDVDDNGEVDAFDASVLMRYILDIDPAPYAPLPWEDWRIIIADASNDGILDSYDCSVILQYVVGVINEW